MNRLFNKIIVVFTCFMLLVGIQTQAAEVIVTPPQISEALSGSATFEGLTFIASKSNATNEPVINATTGDLRVYAKGTFSIQATDYKITQVVFTLSNQGKRRLAPITVSVGNIALQQVGDTTVTWTGGAYNLTFTVGDKAIYGSDGSTKAGQFCFDQIAITTEEENGGTTRYTFSTAITPVQAGTVTPSGSQKIAEGSKVVCATTANSSTNYTFKRWVSDDGTEVSSSRSFTYTMPKHDVTLTAVYEYDPTNPSDPNTPMPKHKVTLSTRPAKAGTFNWNAITEVAIGTQCDIYTYYNNGFWFREWQRNGETVSTNKNYQFEMPDEDVALVAVYDYSPSNPSNPNKNFWNESTGEVIVDDFSAGNLNSAIYSAIGGSNNTSKVNLITVSGIVNQSDWGILNNYTNSTFLDMSRTTGLTYVPSYNFNGNTKLQALILPASIESISNYAFQNCSGLSKIDIYAVTPPSIGYNAFKGVGDMLVHVPAEGLAAYQDADGWKEFTILPLDTEVSALEVNMPEGVDMSLYKDMYIELVNTKSGQKMRYIITNRTTYTFSSLIHRTNYNVYLKNAQGLILGEIPNIDIEEQDVSVNFENLLIPRDLTITVETPDGNDITKQVSVTWMDEKGNFLAKGNTLERQLEGAKVKYRVALPQSLAMKYLMPTDAEYEVQANNNIICTLTAIPQTTITGKVTDVKTGRALSGAIVVASQLLNGQYSKTFTTKTDAKGEWTLNVYQAKTDITASMTDFVSQTQSFDAPTGIVSSFELKEISGTTISLKMTYTDTTGETQNYYNDYANVSYTIFNESTQQQLTKMEVQYPYIVLMESLPDGTKLHITAESKTGKFMPVTAIATVNERDEAIVTLPIKQLGGISASFSETDNNNVVGVLYDDEGRMVKKYDYNKNILTINELIDGYYTLVTMGNSLYYNTISSITELEKIGLRENIDFVKNNIVIESAAISYINNTFIPYLDNSKLYYTDKKTTLTVNKHLLTVGNYLTINSHIDFKSIYADAVKDVNLVFSIPDKCIFVNNSVMVGNILSSYTYDNNEVTIPIHNYNDRIRFCIIPTDGGNYNVTATAHFSLNNNEIMQPIGNASFTAESFKINVPAIVADSTITISGVSPSKSSIKIFDNNTLIGQTNSNAGGSWSTRVSLSKAYNPSFHHINAEIVDENGQRYVSETKTLELNRNAVQLERIRMLYFNPEINKHYDIIFDQKDGSVNEDTYVYYIFPPGENFTFIAEFNNCDTSLVRNVEFNILASDKTIRRVPAKFDKKQLAWIATSTYENSNKIPVNVSVDFFNAGYSATMDPKYGVEENQGIYKYLQAFNDNFNLDNCSMTEQTETYSVFTYKDEKMESPLNIRFDVLDYNELQTIIAGKEYVSGQRDNLEYCMTDSIDGSNYIFYVWNIKNKYAASFSMRLGGTQSPHLSPKKRIIPLLITGGLLIAGKTDYLRDCLSYDYWHDRVNNFYGEERSMYEKTREMIYATCSDGSPKLQQVNIDMFEELLRLHNQQRQTYLDRLGSLLDTYNDRLWSAWWRNTAFDVVLGAGGTIVKGATGITKFIGELGSTLQQQIAGGVVAATEGSIGNMITDRSLSLFHVESVRERMEREFNACRLEIINEYNDFQNNISKHYLKCPKEKDKDGDGEARLKPSIDPSGYVYEAVSSNRVQGATASCYYKEMVEDMYGDLHENIVLWNAEEYAQENPLFTDENGMYRWDVPQGLWQVKFEKEGYQTTYSEWLPVPPPQLDVNIAMTQLVQPQVKSGKAYSEGVEVEFDKYMDPETLTDKNITMTRNGVKVESSIELLNEEVAYEGQSQTYASKVRLNVPEGQELLSTDEVQLTISRKVKSYAGLPMEQDYNQTFDVEAKIREIAVDSLINVAYGGERTLIVAALPAEASKGKTLKIKSLSTMIASANAEEITLDENGQAEVTIAGELPGSTVVSFNVADADVDGRMIVNVKDAANLVTFAPKASRISGTQVYRGTKIQLSSETKDAVIYYTLDGSCPCSVNSESVLVYNPEEPIIIADDNVTIKAMAKGVDLEESETSEFTYTLKKTALNYQLPNGWLWLSHNLEGPVTVSDFVTGTDTERILGQTTETVKDPQWGFFGNLTELQPGVGYKVKTNGSSEKPLNGYEFNARDNAISVANGWNWIGYPINQVMTINEALAYFPATTGDYIVGQDGFAEYDGSTWVGTLEGMKPGQSFLFKSAVDTEILFNTNIVSNAVSKIGKRKILQDSPWAYDKYAYKDVMPVIAELYANGSKISDGGYVVGAFAGTECRGIGQWKEGRLLLSVYGDSSEDITFIAFDANSDKYYNLSETLVLTPVNQGNWFNPIVLTLGSETTKMKELYNDLQIDIKHDHIKVNAGGRNINHLTLTNMNGVTLIKINGLGTGGVVDTGSLPEGIYILSAQIDGKTYYKKFHKTNK